MHGRGRRASPPDHRKEYELVERYGSRLWAVCAAAAVALFALASAVVLVVPARETQAQTSSGAAEGGGKLQVERRTEDAIGGAYGYAGSLVAYKSERDASGRVIESSVVVDGKVLEARKDLVTQEITFDGHDNALSAAQSEALVAMIMEVDRTDIALEGAPPQEDFLYRLIEYVSSAPSSAVLGRYAVPEGSEGGAAAGSESEPRQQTVKFELASSTVSPEAVETEALGLADPLAASSGASTASEECDEAQTVAPWDVTTVFVACNQRDDDGIAYLTCQNKNRAVSYDGKNNCFKKFYGYYSGPHTSRCKGRCGPGCGARAKGKYTQDCLDHDACCGRYGGCINGAFGSCADEFREADDDVFRARRNCYNGS